MINRLCDPEHLAIIILVLLVALLVVGGGKGIGKLLGPILKKIFGGGTEVTLNLGGEMAKKSRECETCGLVVDPRNCPLHEAEHERSKRNEEEINKLWEHYGKMGEEMRSGFKEVQRCINESQKTILIALGSRPRGE
jgi:hypothetical protein